MLNHKMIVPFHRPSIGEEEIAAVVDTMKSGWLSSGPKVIQFEKDFASAIGAKHAIAVNSCTAALHLSLEAIGLKQGEGVITTPLTFAATAEVIRYFKAHPIFVDIDPTTGNINPDIIEDALIAHGDINIRAIIPVHFAGRPCAMDRIMQITRNNGIHVVEDAAHALPASIGIHNIGSIGDLTCFSFYATKTITTGEGGMVTTNNDDFADRIKKMRLHGVDRDIWNRYTSDKPKWFYQVTDIGYKYNMTDIAAAMGIEQLKKVYDFWEIRQKIAYFYNEVFADLPIILPNDVDYLPRGSRHAWHLYIIRLDNANIQRNEFIELMAKHGIGTSVHFMPIHMHRYWKDEYGFADEDFPEALRFYESCVSLPIYPGMGEYETYIVADTIRKILTGVLK